MKTRLLCGVIAAAMAGLCPAEEPAEATRTASQSVMKQYSPPTRPHRQPPVVGIPIGSAFTNRGSSGGGYTCCGPGTQYLATGCAVRLDLSHGIGLWDPCNAWRPHPGPNCGRCY